MSLHRSEEPIPFDDRLRWVREQMPLTAASLSDLPDLAGVRLACSMHLEIKMVPAILGLQERGASVLLTTCNPTTVDDESVGHCEKAGVIAHARRDMSPEELSAAIESAIAFAPTHLCEMGADLTAALSVPRHRAVRTKVKAGLEATGSGTDRLAGIALEYPIFNWDDLPIKEGLHNRRMVGLVACHAFFQRTQITFHGKRVLVVGYGLVGRSACDAARAFGGRVLVADRDPGRALEASFAGEEIVTLDEALPRADVVVTATGARHVLGPASFVRLKDGVFLLNVGHRDEEIDVPALRAHGTAPVLPFLERITVEGRRVHLFAGGSMANLTAGHGDSLNAFDVTLAAMLAGIDFMIRRGEAHPPGMHDLPPEAWRRVAERAVGG
jgi:adenosylhomocysteinase